MLFTGLIFLKSLTIKKKYIKELFILKMSKRYGLLSQLKH